MFKRYVAIWFRHLKTDWMVRRHPQLKDVPFVMAAPDHGRMVIQSVNAIARENGIDTGMVVADCRAILPSLQVFDDEEGLAGKLLHALAEWCLRYTPVVAVQLPDGLILDATGCAHLWSGERAYLEDMTAKLKAFGYDVRLAMAGTIGAAWAVSRFGKAAIIAPGDQSAALLSLPAEALRLEAGTAERLSKLGLQRVESFMHMPRRALRKRFGESILTRIDQALGSAEEFITSIQPVEPYQERLPCMEPIRTATGIAIALRQLLEALCARLAREQKGMRKGVFKCFRVDGMVQVIGIDTSRASHHADHLFRLFELKIPTIEPAFGIEVFILEAPVVEDASAAQDTLWNFTEQGNEGKIAELLDTITGRLGGGFIHRYLPDKHYWPERSVKEACSLSEKPQTAWNSGMPRPIHLLPQPERIEVSVLIPDYPPMLFRYKDELHHVAKADGPERIEQEWWLQHGCYRDYYCVEDEAGGRYWLFRLGSYDDGNVQWFIHGFFA
jgi:protein ImuB